MLTRERLRTYVVDSKFISHCDRAFLDAAGAARNDAAAKPRRCPSQCEHLLRGSLSLTKVPCLQYSGAKNSGPSTAPISRT